MRRLKQCVSLLFVLAAGCALAQQDRGTFTGTVTDPSGSVVPSVAITVTNTETNATYNSATNEVGQYTVPNLPIGRYRITFEAGGFRRFVRDGLTLDVAQVARIDAQLQLGATTEAIEVTAVTPLLQTETPDVGTVLEQRNVIDLPLSFSGGRSPENFAYRLTPGVEGNNWTSRINGSPAFSKEVLLDGASATIYLAGHFGESSVSMEALEEFKVQTSGMSAEYGRTGGGIFNFVMRSGTNQIHGSGMGQLRNEWMDANTFANNFYGRPRQRDRRHNWAGSFGGPVYLPKIYNGKDKSFFYVAYERYKDANRGLGSPNRTVPLLEWYDGDMSRYLTTQVLGKDALGRDVLRGQIYDPASLRTVDGKVIRDPFAGNIIPKSRISRVSRNVGEIMKKHYAPAVKQADGLDAMINNSFFPTYNTASFEQIQFSVKGDHYVSAQHKLSASFAYIDRPRILLDQGGYWDPNDPDGGPFSRARLQTVRSKYGRLAYDWTVSARLLNHFVVAANRQANPSISRHISEPGAQILGLTGIDQTMNYPEIIWTGGDRVNLDRIGYQANGMLGGTTYQATDTLSWLKNRHSIKFGLDWRNAYLNDRNAGGPGSFTFTGDLTGLPGFSQTGHPFASFLLGQVQSASAPAPTPTGSTLPALGLFVQDDFKVSSRLTLNLGLRWDYQPQQIEKYDRLHSFNPNLTDPATGLPGAVEYAGQGEGRNGKRTFYGNQFNDFGPRVGLAYQVRNRLVFRGAYGVFFSARAPNDWNGTPYGYPFGFTRTNTVPNPGNNLAAFNWDDGFPGQITAAALDPSLANYTWGVVSWDPDGGKVAYAQQWNVNLQLELPAQTVLDLGYVGTKATGIIGNQLRQINQMPTSALELRDTLGQWISSDSGIPAAAKALGARYPFPKPGTSIPVRQTLQPFPQVPYWGGLLAYNAPLGFSTYNALEIALNKRFSRGLSWIANYTFSKALDNLEDAFSTWTNTGRPIDYYNLRLEKTVSPYDMAHVVKVGASYQLPVGKGKAFASGIHPVLNAIIGGWTLQYIGNYRSGTPLGFSGTATPNTNFATNRALIVNPNNESLRVPFDESRFDMSRISTAGTASHAYVNTSIVKDPPRYVRGDAPYRMAGIRGFPEYNEDFGLQKNFTIGERFKVQIRGEWLEAFNRHRFSSVATNPASPLFGQVTGVSGSVYRQSQVGIRADW